MVSLPILDSRLQDVRDPCHCVSLIFVSQCPEHSANDCMGWCGH